MEGTLEHKFLTLEQKDYHSLTVKVRNYSLRNEEGGEEDGEDGE